MPNSTRETVLCRYHYDPLDRQNGCTALQQPAIQRFHCKSRLATEIQGSARWSIFQHDDQLLAQHSHLDAKVTATLLATDQQRSVLNALEATQPNPLAYTPYGHRPAKNSLLSLLGFNGERPDPVTGHYHLGNGYRQFNPVLMRFNSPDSWSPFGEGGLNAYGYCVGDPVNKVDPNGHAFGSFLMVVGGVASIVGGVILVKKEGSAAFIGGLALMALGVAAIGAGIGGMGASSFRSLADRRLSSSPPLPVRPSPPLPSTTPISFNIPKPLPNPRPTTPVSDLSRPNSTNGVFEPHTLDQLKSIGKFNIPRPNYNGTGGITSNSSFSGTSNVGANRAFNHPSSLDENIKTTRRA
jgi:RHS repeat-associated protein